MIIEPERLNQTHKRCRPLVVSGELVAFLIHLIEQPDYR
ncbi:hypothetical protein C7534_13421 [Pseudomonas sp. OV226]|nr:hypothetical protein C7534_13421 [Pseudomonas sp. OV226]